MKRYALYAALAFSGGVGLVLYLSAFVARLADHWPLLIGAALLLTWLGLRVQQYAVPVIAAALLCGAAYTQGYTAWLVEPLLELHEQTLRITATVRAYPDLYEDSQRVEVSVDCAASEIPYVRSKFSAIGYLPLTEQPLHPGDTVCADVAFYVPTIRQGFDRQRYQMANGNFISFSYVRAERGDPQAQFCSVHSAEQIALRDRPLHWARHWGESIMQILPAREGGFLRAMMLGDKRDLDVLDALRLRKVGLSHIIAVSGMHLMFLVGLCSHLFSRKLGVPISVVIVLLFIPMAGASPSILRAGIMTLLSCAAFFFNTTADRETSLGLALLILLLWNPYALFSLSLQLSFLSTFGILRFATPMERTLFGALYEKVANKRLRRLLRLIGATICCSASAVLATTPILISAFGYLTLLSIPANLLTFSVIGLTFELGILLCLIPITQPILASVLTVLIDYILGCADLLDGLQWGILYWEDLAGRTAVVAVTALVLVLVFGKWSHPRITAPILGAILMGSVWMAYNTRCETTTITIHAVGDGQMITVADGYDHVSLIDCGSAANQNSARSLAEYLYWNGFEQIDTMILTAVDKGHARACGTVIQTYPIDRLIVPDQLKENDTVQTLRQAAAQRQLPIEIWKLAGEHEVYLPGISASIVGGIDRKLGVRLRGASCDLLILHSMTQTMLHTLLLEQPLQAQSVVLANQFEKDDLLRHALETIQPEQIYLSSGYLTAHRLHGIPTANTAEAGDLIITCTHQ